MLDHASHVGVLPLGFVLEHLPDPGRKVEVDRALLTSPLAGGQLRQTGSEAAVGDLRRVVAAGAGDQAR